MNKLFLTLYDLFRRHRRLLWMLLAVTTLGMGAIAMQLSFSEDITSFLPNDRQGSKTAKVFKNLRVKDKIVILIDACDSTATPERLIEAADAIAEGLQPAVDKGLLRSITVRIDAGMLDAATHIVYDHLPIFYTDRDFARLDSITRPEAIDRAISRNRSLLTSTAGIAIQEFLLRDPLGMGTHLLSGFRQFDTSANYELYDDHLFTPDLQTLILFADPSGGSSATADNDRLISLLEEQLIRAETDYQVRADYFGAAGIAVYNARQIKRDTMWTLTIAMIVIIGVIFLAFRSRRAIPLMIAPVIYGMLFALATIYFIQGSISSIAIGAGAAVLGVALSYSIHVLAHSNHTRDPRRIITELAYPLTIGSFTTVGAFMGLIFTRSQLLHDFGLFSALTLIGTTIFSLVFLPHLLPGQDSPQRSPSRLLRRIERINGYRFDMNRWLAAGIVLTAIVCLFFYDDVQFNSDMRKLSYEPARFLRMEQRLAEIFGSNTDYVYLATTADGEDQAIAAYAATDRMLDSLVAEGMVRESATAADFVIPRTEQLARLARWEAFWSPEKQAEVYASVERAARKAGFRNGAFSSLKELLERDFTLFDPTEVSENPVLSDWINRDGDDLLFVSRIALDDQAKAEVYTCLERQPELSILDRSYFSSRMAEVVSEDFNIILLISSALVFFALLISYGRIELALLASLPMAVSWVLILGIMAMTKIEFNIVTIILSTFIFGLGDDFSIFIMDGLLTEYRDGRKLLAAHKTAIFFSAFTTVVGLGVLIFARHPALHALSVISIIGMAAVVLVAYTVQPILFRLLISGQTTQGGYPYTLAAILNTLYAFLYFLVGCILLQLLLIGLHLLPIGRSRRKAWFHCAIYGFTRLFLATMFTTRTQRLNPEKERFDRPAIIIANHQSFIDILLLLSTTPRLVMVTNSWVWHSPFFGRIVRYAGFLHTADGYESLAASLRQELAEGYSVVIFPEGTRSENCTIRRFHKGAFQLAEQLDAEIVPTLIYGAGNISSKRQPFYIKRGILTTLILPRIAPDDSRFGSDIRERTRAIRRYMAEEYERLKAMHSDDPRHRSAVIRNYIYKGPVLEWYIRVKLRLEHNYDLPDQLLPRDARIVDLGCGYGQAAFMLAMRGDRRQLLGIDYDAKKIALANQSFLACERIRFQCADITDCNLPSADAFLLNDVCHYLPHAVQEALLTRCTTALSEGGLIVVREGDKSVGKRHCRTEATERWSTRILSFNQARSGLHFISTERMQELAGHLGLHLDIYEPQKHTSNRYYVFRKGGKR